MLGNATVVAVVPTTDLARAKRFYGDTLGLSAQDAPMPGEAAVVYGCGSGTRLLVYERATAGESPATIAAFAVEDFDATAERMRSAGIQFEDYELPGIRTQDGVVSMDGFKAAWFRDPDGNILNLSNDPRS